MAFAHLHVHTEYRITIETGFFTQVDQFLYYVPCYLSIFSFFPKRGLVLIRGLISPVLHDDEVPRFISQQPVHQDCVICRCRFPFIRYIRIRLAGPFSCRTVILFPCRCLIFPFIIRNSLISLKPFQKNI